MKRPTPLFERAIARAKRRKVREQALRRQALVGEVVWTLTIALSGWCAFLGLCYHVTTMPQGPESNMACAGDVCVVVDSMSDIHIESRPKP